MMRTAVSAVVMVAAVSIASATLAGAASGQRPYRSGFWAELGFDQSRLLYSCAGCSDVTYSSPGGTYLRIGGAVSRSVVVGVEAATSVYDSSVNESPVEDDPYVAENSILSAIVLWFPFRSGFFLKGGVGLAGGQVTFDVPGLGETLAEGTGVGLTYGIGWDLPIWRAFTLTLNAGSRVHAIGDLPFPTGLIDDVIVTTYAFGIGITLR